MTKQEENDLIWESFICNESPQRIDGNMYTTGKMLETLSGDVLRTTYGEPLGTLKDGTDVYHSETYMIFFFVLNNVVTAYYNYIENPDGGVISKTTWSNPHHRGSFSKIFISYLLPTFKIIQSDSRLTTLGFKFWENIMSKYPQFDYFIKIGNDYTPISDYTELSNYWNIDMIGEKSSFVVKYDK